MALLDIESEQTMTREQLAGLLRDLADQLARHNQLEVDKGGLPIKVEVPDQVTVGIELEVGDDGNELEIEISW